MQETLYDALVKEKVKLVFEMKTGSAPGGYNPYSKRISFNSDDNITSETLKEELFHAWQDACYFAGISQYGNDNQGNKLPGYVNLEFEAKVYKDIIGHHDGSCCFAFREEHIPIEVRNKYYFWIASIRFRPDRSFSDADYTKWLDLFNQ